MIDEESGIGKRCLGLSAAPPPFCQNLPEPPEEIDGQYAKEWLSFGWRSRGWNSNVDVEEAVGVSARHDLCDPVPQLRFVGEPPVLLLEQWTSPSVYFWAQPILGGGSWEKSMRENVDFLHCTCDPQWGQGDCKTYRCDPRMIRAQVPTNWTANLSVIGGRYKTFHESEGDESLWADASRFSWDWLQDASSGLIHARVEEDGSYSTLGFFATTVLGERWQSRRDSEWGGALRSVLGYGATRAADTPRDVFVPHWGEKLRRSDDPIQPCDPLSIIRDPGRSPGAFNYPYFLPHGLNLGPYGFAEWSQSPSALVMDDKGSLSAVRDEQRTLDLTSHATNDFLDVLQNWAPLTFHSPVEPQAALAALGLQGSMIGVADCHGNGVYSLTHDGMLSVRDLSIPISMTNEMRGAYSAAEEVLYLVGGGGSALRTVRRIRLHEGSIETSSLELGPEAKILGASYDPGSSTLYVLDVEGSTARLVAHGLPEGGSNLLWSVPFTDKNAYTSLDVAEDGNLVLTTGRASTFTSCRLDKTGAVLGRIDGQGQLARLPTMGWHFLSALYFNSEGFLEQQLLDPSSFIGSEACIDL